MTKTAHPVDGVKQPRPCRRHAWTIPSLLAAAFAAAPAAGTAAAADQIPARPVSRATPAATSHPLTTPIRLVEASLQTVAEFEDFEATFLRRERVGTQNYSSTMKMRFRRRPFSVYLGFQGEHEGREVLYVEGRNQNRMLAHDAGFRGLFGTVALDPKGATAMAEGRHPITEIGLEKMAAGIIARWKGELKYRDIGVKYYPDARFSGKPCLVIETSHPVQRRGEPFAMTRVYIDKQSKILFRLQHFGFPDASGSSPLLEDYTYTDIRPNRKLSDRMFDARNPDYGF